MGAVGHGENVLAELKRRGLAQRHPLSEAERHSRVLVAAHRAAGVCYDGARRSPPGSLQEYRHAFAIPRDEPISGAGRRLE